MCSIMRLFHLSKTRKSGSESASTETSRSQGVDFLNPTINCGMIYAIGRGQMFWEIRINREKGE